MNGDQLGYIGQGIFNILRKHIDDEELRWNITERMMDLVVLMLDEKKAKEFIDVYNRKHSNRDSDTIEIPQKTSSTSERLDSR